MTPETRQKLVAAIQCLPDEASLRAYAERLAADQPEEAREVRTGMDCYLRSHDMAACLPNAVASEPDLVSLCGPIVSEGDLSISSGSDRNDYMQVLQESVFDTEAYRRLSPGGREALNSLFSFYASRLSSTVISSLRAVLASNSEWSARLNAFERRPEPRGGLVYSACPNASDWELHEISIAGLPQRIPVLLPRGHSYPWEYYDQLFRIEIQELQAFLTPEDWERLLHPGGGRADLTFYASGRELGGREIANACGMLESEALGGQYHDARTVISIDSSPLGLEPTSSFQSSPVRILNRVLGIGSMTHEIGHAIDFLLLDAPSRRGIESLYRWTRNQWNADRSDARLRPSGSNYALTNAREFFAVWVDEYVYGEVLSRVGSGEYRASSPYYDARIEIMREVFSSRGINPQALSRENIEATFRRHGIAMNLPDIESGSLEISGAAVFPTFGDPQIFFRLAGLSMREHVGGGGGVILRGLNSGFSAEAEGFFRWQPFSVLGFDSLVRLGIQDRPALRWAPIAGVGLRTMIGTPVGNSISIHAFVSGLIYVDFVQGTPFATAEAGIGANFPF